jgi:hypothetical protein
MANQYTSPHGETPISSRWFCASLRRSGVQTYQRCWLWRSDRPAKSMHRQAMTLRARPVAARPDHPIILTTLLHRSTFIFFSFLGTFSSTFHYNISNMQYLVLIVALTATAAVEARKITVVNRCTETIWPGMSAFTSSCADFVSINITQVHGP